MPYSAQDLSSSSLDRGGEGDLVSFNKDSSSMSDSGQLIQDFLESLYIYVKTNDETAIYLLFLREVF